MKDTIKLLNKVFEKEMQEKIPVWCKWCNYKIVNGKCINCTPHNAFKDCELCEG